MQHFQNEALEKFPNGSRKDIGRNSNKVSPSRKFRKKFSGIAFPGVSKRLKTALNPLNALNRLWNHPGIPLKLIWKHVKPPENFGNRFGTSWNALKCLDTHWTPPKHQWNLFETHSKACETNLAPPPPKPLEQLWNPVRLNALERLFWRHLSP